MNIEERNMKLVKRKPTKGQSPRTNSMKQITLPKRKKAENARIKTDINIDNLVRTVSAPAFQSFAFLRSNKNRITKYSTIIIITDGGSTNDIETSFRTTIYEGTLLKIYLGYTEFTLTEDLYDVDKKLVFLLGNLLKEEVNRR